MGHRVTHLGNQASTYLHGALRRPLAQRGFPFGFECKEHRAHSPPSQHTSLPPGLDAARSGDWQLEPTSSLNSCVTLGEMLPLSGPPQTRCLRVLLTWACLSLINPQSEPSQHGLCTLVMSWHWLLASRNPRRLCWAFVGATSSNTGSWREGPVPCCHPHC